MDEPVERKGSEKGDGERRQARTRIRERKQGKERNRAGQVSEVLNIGARSGDGEKEAIGEGGGGGRGGGDR